MKIRKKNALNINISILIMFVMWSFIFTMTNTSWASFVYVFLGVIIINIFSVMLLFKPHIISARILMWLPFISLSVLGNMKLRNFEGCVYFFACMILLLISSQINWELCFPFKVFYISGCLVAFGIIFQILFPSLYDTYIATFFQNSSDILYWEKGYGYAGFTYQLGVTAIILIYLEGILLYKNRDNTKVSFIITLMIVILIFLTGKRTIAILAILLPLLIELLCNKFDSKRLFFILCLIFLISMIVYVFAINSELFIDSKVLGRFASTITDLEKGLDISSHRTTLYYEALNMFKEKRLFGIGLGQFKEQSVFATDVHNTYLQVLCEQGIIGSILFYFPLFTSLFLTIKQSRKNNHNNTLKIALFLQLFFIAYGMTGNVTVNEICYVVYFFSISVVEGITTKINTGANEL